MLARCTVSRTAKQRARGPRQVFSVYLSRLVNKYTEKHTCSSWFVSHRARSSGRSADVRHEPGPTRRGCAVSVFPARHVASCPPRHHVPKSRPWESDSHLSFTLPHTPAPSPTRTRWLLPRSLPPRLAAVASSARRRTLTRTRTTTSSTTRHRRSVARLARARATSRPAKHSACTGTAVSRCRKPAPRTDVAAR